MVILIDEQELTFVNYNPFASETPQPKYSTSAEGGFLSHEL
jgi:hypothetical protein